MLVPARPHILQRIAKRRARWHLRQAAAEQARADALERVIQQDAAEAQSRPTALDVVSEVDWSQCEVVESVPGRLAGAPVLLGTRLPVQTVLDNYDDGLEPEQVAAIFEVAASDVITVLKFRQAAS